MSSNLPLARRDEIAHRLAGGTAVVANELAFEFNVSADAIRRDLRALAANGLCRRVYGGALPTRPSASPTSDRNAHALARAASAVIQLDELLFLDRGEANIALMQYLSAGQQIVTTSLTVAAAALRRPDIQLRVIGGAVTSKPSSAPTPLPRRPLQGST